MKKAFLVKLLSLIFTLCSAICVFTACNSHVHEFSYSTVKTATCVESGSMLAFALAVKQQLSPRPKQSIISLTVLALSVVLIKAVKISLAFTLGKKRTV